MEYVYASLLLHSIKKPITVENLTKVLQAAGVEPEEGKLKALVTSLEGQDIDQLIKQAAVMPTSTEHIEKKEEKKKEEEKKSVEEAATGLSALFG